MPLTSIGEEDNVTKKRGACGGGLQGGGGGECTVCYMEK